MQEIIIETLLFISFIVIACLIIKLNYYRNSAKKIVNDAVNICHDFKTTLTSLHLASDGLKDLSNKFNGGELISSINLIDDIGHNMLLNIAQLSKLNGRFGVEGGQKDD